MSKLISIIVPVYQAEKTIQRCLTSILTSTYKNLEIIAVDDGSTDKSAAIIQALAEKDPRIHLIQMPNGGVSKARNTGLSHAQGEFIGFVDSDDYIDKRMYESMLEHMTDACDLTICGSYHCNEAGEITDKKLRALSGYKKSCPKEALASVIYERTTMAVWSKLYRRHVILNDAGQLLIKFHENFTNYEDLGFTCEYLARCNGYITFVPLRLYYYCYNPESLSGKTVPPDNLRDSLSLLVKLGDAYNDPSFTAPKLFYTETFLKYWYIQIFRHREYKKTEAYPEHSFVLKEIQAFLPDYLSAKNVSLYKKAAANMLIHHDALTFALVKLLRPFIKF